jgi:hypothetical protein
LSARHSVASRRVRSRRNQRAGFKRRVGLVRYRDEPLQLHKTLSGEAVLESHEPKVDREFLKVIIQPWLTEKLRIGAASLVIVDNVNGKFTITRSAANEEPAQ